MRYVIRLWTVDTRTGEKKSKSGLRKVRGEMVVSADNMGEVNDKIKEKLDGMTKAQKAAIGRMEIGIEKETDSDSTPFDNVPKK